MCVCVRLCAWERDYNWHLLLTTIHVWCVRFVFPMAHYSQLPKSHSKWMNTFFGSPSVTDSPEPFKTTKTFAFGPIIKTCFIFLVIFSVAFHSDKTRKKFMLVRISFYYFHYLHRNTQYRTKIVQSKKCDKVRKFHIEKRRQQRKGPANWPRPEGMWQNTKFKYLNQSGRCACVVVCNSASNA